MSSRRSRGFPPIATPAARILILGSLPGQVSLARRQYYAQPQNSFWRIMGVLVGAGPDLPYEDRTRCLQEQHIALWDVCKAARRPGSLDSAIDLGSVVPNDFKAFFADHPQLGRIFTNGGTATRLYTRLVLPRLPARWQAMPLQPLPSTSPAHAAMRFEQKLALWQVVADALRGKT
jgi:TDG/mug DNA glycosylase family protein